MTTEERYSLIKKICESRNQKTEYGEMPYSDKDLRDEFLRFDTSVQTLPTEQDSRLWQKSFFQDLVFGS